MRQQERATQETSYKLGQSCYRTNQDARADYFFSRVSADSDLYPLALYARAQIAFRKGDSNLAETYLGILAATENQSRVPEMLRDLARLNLARVLYQQGEFKAAADSFRKLNRSPFFLTEALMGMGWCREAMDEPDKAIAYFHSAEEASSHDFLDTTKASLEKGRLLAEIGLYPDSFKVFESIQENTKRYVAFLNQYAGDPAWLGAQTKILLPEESGKPDSDPSSGASFSPTRMQEEAEYILEKQSYVSARLRKLYEIRDSLERIESMLSNPPDSDAEKSRVRGLSAAAYPPLQTPEAGPDAATFHLLDASIALLDTEYRMDETDASLGHAGPDELEASFRQTEGFYRPAFRQIVQFTPEDSKNAYGAINRMMSIVCNLPASVEERERIMKKLIYAKQSLQDSEETLLRWERSMQVARAGALTTSRPVLLDMWMIYVRTLIYLNTWTERSPSVFLLPTIQYVPYRGEALESAAIVKNESLSDRMTVIRQKLDSLERKGISSGRISEIRERLDLIPSRHMLEGRVAETWRRLHRSFQKEIRIFYDERRKVLEGLVTTNEMYYAQALLQHQKSLLRDIQSQSPEAIGEGIRPDEGVGAQERAPVEEQQERPSGTTNTTDEAIPAGGQTP